MDYTGSIIDLCATPLQGITLGDTTHNSMHLYSVPTGIPASRNAETALHQLFGVRLSHDGQKLNTHASRDVALSVDLLTVLQLYFVKQSRNEQTAPGALTTSRSNNGDIITGQQMCADSIRAVSVCTSTAPQCTLLVACITVRRQQLLTLFVSACKQR